MATHKVTLRKMTPAEYEAATQHREAESARELGKLMPAELARERTRHGTARFLPDGLDTARHHLVVAENEAGEVVGNAWVGPDPRQAAGIGSAAWLYDINVFPEYRRHGYGSAILTAAEALIRSDGCTSLGLNVAGDNDAAIALYQSSGYTVTTMSMRKGVPG